MSVIKDRFRIGRMDYIYGDRGAFQKAQRLMEEDKPVLLDVYDRSRTGGVVSRARLDLANREIVIEVPTAAVQLPILLHGLDFFHNLLIQAGLGNMSLHDFAFHYARPGLLPTYGERKAPVRTLLTVEPQAAHLIVGHKKAKVSAIKVVSEYVPFLGNVYGNREIPFPVSALVMMYDGENDLQLKEPEIGQLHFVVAPKNEPGQRRRGLKPYHPEQVRLDFESEKV